MVNQGPKRLNPVELSYPVEIYGLEKRVKLPFVIGVITDLSGDSPSGCLPIYDRKFMEYDRDNFNDRLKAIKPIIEVPICEKGSSDLKNYFIQFENLDGFCPLGIVNSTPHLRHVMSKRTLLADLCDKLEAKPGLLPMIQPYLEQARQLSEKKNKLSTVAIAQLDEQEAPGLSIDVDEWKPGMLKLIAIAADDAHNVLCEMVSQVACHNPPENFSLPAEITHWVKEIDSWLEHQVNQVLHHKAFLKLESSWRGLDHLCQRLATDESLKIKVLNVSPEEMRRDPDLTAGVLVKQITNGEFGQLGGEPFNLLLVDFYFDQTPESMELLELLSEVATVSASPLVGGASPVLFHCADHRELHERHHIDRLLKLPEYERWNAFGLKAEARNVALALPRLVAREPFADAGADPGSFRFVESETGHDHKPWINPAFAVAEAAANRHLDYGWISARENEPLDLAGFFSTSDFNDGDEQLTVTCPTETCLTNALVDQLASLNLMCLQRYTGHDSAKIVNWVSLLNSDALCIPNADQASRFDVNLSINYFCHYLATFLRDNTGSYFSFETAEKLLTDWSQSYVAQDENPQELRPLKCLKIELVPGWQLEGRTKGWLLPRLRGQIPGAIGVAHIQPQWLTDNLDSPIACYFPLEYYWDYPSVFPSPSTLA